MGKIITIVGNSGIGKTTFAKAICASGAFVTGLEPPLTERPFQAHTAADPARYGLANQIDFLLLRAQQERELRHGAAHAIIDGGLDLDYHGFTRLFHGKGFLGEAEYALCTRLYVNLRELLGPPDFIIRLTAPLSVIAERYARRGRSLELAQRDDLISLEEYIDTWLARETESGIPVLTIDATADEYISDALMADLILTIALRWSGIEPSS